MQNMPKTGADRQREYRLRKNANRPPKPPKSPAKTSRERVRLHRERKKLLQRLADCNQKYDWHQPQTTYDNPMACTSRDGEVRFNSIYVHKLVKQGPDRDNIPEVKDNRLNTITDEVMVKREVVDELDSNFIYVAREDQSMEIKYENLRVKEEFPVTSDRTEYVTYSGGKDAGDYIEAIVQCDIWREHHSTTQELLKHRFVHTTDSYYTCLICHITCSQKAMLDLHILQHSSSLLYECDLCHKLYCSHTTLTNHKRIHVDEKPFQCDICEKQFRERYMMTQHMRVHDEVYQLEHKPNVFQCDICLKPFSRIGDLNIYYRIHSGEKPYECPICHKRLTHDSSLSKHRQAHDGEPYKPYECLICHKRYNSASSLNESKKQFECDICHRRFSYERDRNYHMRIHTGDNLCECVICHKRFSKPASLNKHMQIHSDGKPFECDISERGFEPQVQLNSNNAIHEPISKKDMPFECVFVVNDAKINPN